ncbi:MAG: alpha/beta hydrolase, partial [Verrucomicrobiales bacterium]|nr:alpha/beta hydrolase [Verrucomicrobiales bacterium]
MNSRYLRPVVLALAAAVALGGGSANAAPPVPDLPIRLWPGQAPGESKALPPEADTTKPTDNPIAGRRLIRLGNVSEPTLQVYRPPAHLNTGAAVLVCPGGGYHILAMDLEGTEVCEWLHS